ncbi:Transcriptional regulator [Bacillus sp. IT-79MI2]|nr:hypothetical protein BTH41_02440 [Bacillus mycoides]
MTGKVKYVKSIVGCILHIQKITSFIFTKNVYFTLFCIV